MSDTAAHFIGQTHTATGLSVIVEKARKIYHAAQKAMERFLNHMPMVFNDHLPDLNYFVTSGQY